LVVLVGRSSGDNHRVVFDPAAWLIGLLADAGRRKLTDWVLGTDQARALRSVAAAAVRLTAKELCPDDDEQAEHMTLVISQVFGAPVPGDSLTRYQSLLEALQAGVAGQLAILDDASLTGTGESSSGVLGVPATVLAEKLTGHLLREIVARGAQGGPLYSLATQLNQDVTHLQGRQICDAVRELGRVIQEGLASEAEVRVRPPELAPLVSPPERRREIRSVASLLRADAEAIRFRGRDGLLEELTSWCMETAFPVRLLVGPGGEGKTRLAQELAARLRERDWAAGFLTGSRDYGRLDDTTVPLLLVIDYAETRPAQVRQVVEQVLNRAGEVPVRVLLLARSAGEWWQRLTGASADLEDALTGAAVGWLRVLETTMKGRRAAYAEALSDLASRLRGLPRYADTDWTAVIPATVRPSLDDAASGSALTLQMMALTALLQAGPNPVAEPPHDAIEDRLLGHERRYWEETAHACGLLFHERTLEQSVAAATLCGAQTADEALMVLAHLPGLGDQPADRRIATAYWLRDLYPAPRHVFWGSLQPDRLGEHLIGRVVADVGSTDLLSRLLPVLSSAQLHRALHLLTRVGVHQPDLAGKLAELLARHLDELAVPVAEVIVQADHPGSLGNALRSLAETSDLSVDLLKRLMDVLPAEPRKELAELWLGIAKRLLTALRKRAAAEPQAFASDLVRTLANLSVIYVLVDKPGLAIAAADKAVRLSRERAGSDLEDVWRAVHNLTAALLNGERFKEAEDSARQAVDAGLQLEDAGWSAVRTADSLRLLAAALERTGQMEEAVQAARESVQLIRSIEEANPGRFTFQAVRALQNLAAALVSTQEWPDALAVTDEAIGLCRLLAARNPNLYTGEVVLRLAHRAALLDKMGDRPAALCALTEMLNLLRARAGKGFGLAGHGWAFAVQIAHGLAPDEVDAVLEEATGKRLAEWISG
jgi:tetratricopeptide (TPR) repeat protein